MDELSLQGRSNIITGSFSVFRLGHTVSERPEDSPDISALAPVDEKDISPGYGLLPQDKNDQIAHEDETLSNDQFSYDLDMFEDHDIVATYPTSHTDLPSPILMRTQSVNDGSYWPHKLMSHYITQLADLLQPIHHPRNPFLTINVQSAMPGLFAALELPGQNSITHSPMKGNMSIFHSLMASAAFHLRGSKSTHHPNWDTLDHIGSFNHRDFIRAYAAILCQVSTDIMEGSMTEFFTHLQACERLCSSHLSNIALEPQKISPPTRQLAVNSAFIATLAQTTTHHPPPYINLVEFKQASLFESPFRTDDTSLEFTYGITSTTASFMYLTNKFWQCAHSAASFGLTVLSEITDAILTLSCLIESWTPSLEPFTSIPANDTASLALARDLAMSFNYATRIYFQSCFSLESSSARSATRAELSELTLMALEKAETNKNMTSRSSKFGVKGASISWPAFVAACEAPPELRPRWAEYWECLINYRIGNLTVVWGTVKDVWKSTDQGSNADDFQSPPNNAETFQLTEPKWSKVLREANFSILAI
ncbi:hypothetical protein LTR10_013556 [Elasticomyces elasticus]|uniref:Transcription factor domain-containing protein n=1 Tax=Exophiala sideris TaxID=1016849 RepID=A0ABR0JQY4_9EURO|nr:hypothetical protein LTR10_013556 [Elasticomyces elasticus]KAK5039694.1 hypothetical protein LTS07_000189 [Exophiala sideris]KAK5068072.1 hypothetical protein LTR69_000190 [Exophiala sideris]KAK5187373.1 hypothetical protein LTR44_000189 [Eurotiomycetes sp. CCFEE 6388]